MFNVTVTDDGGENLLPSFNIFYDQDIYTTLINLEDNTVLFDSEDPDSLIPEEIDEVPLDDFYTSGIKPSIEKVYHLAETWTPNYGADKRLYGVVLRYYNRDTFRSHFRTVHWPRITSLAKFKKELGDLQVYRRDFYEEDDYDDFLESELDTSIFWIRYTDIYHNRIRDYTGSDYMIYKTVTHPDSETNCVFQSVLDCGFARDELRDCENLTELINVIKDNNLPISIIYNIPELKPCDEQYSHITGPVRKFKIKGRKYAKNFWMLRDRHIIPTFAYKAENEAHILCVDISRNHIEKISTPEPMLVDGVWMADYEIVREFPDGGFVVVRHWCNLNRPNIPKASEFDTRFIFFDIECVTDYDSDNFSLPYSMSYVDLSMHEMAEMNDIELLHEAFFKQSRQQQLMQFNDNSISVKAKLFIEKHVKHIIGFNCVTLFLERLRAEVNADEAGNRRVLIGFNNSSYDNFLLLSALNTMMPMDEHPYVNYVEYHGANRIGNIYFFNKLCTTWDLKRHISPGNLSKICASFNIKLFAKKPELISHLKIQLAFFNHKRAGFYANLFNVITKEELEDYNNYDVLSTALIFFRYYLFIDSFECVKKAKELNARLGNIYDHISLPSFMYKISSIFTDHNGIILPDINHSQYEFMRSSMIAGRIDTFRKERRRYDEEIMSLDVTSMYAYVMFVMNNCYFPSDDLLDAIMTEEEAESLERQWEENQNFDLIGFYTVNINQHSLFDNGHPMIICKKHDLGNDWESNDEFVMFQNNIVLSSIDILQLKKYDCEVEFVIGARCIQFSGKVRNYDLFGFLSDFMKEKNRQDWIAANEGENSSNYNPCVRALAKACPNGLSGKYTQKVFTTVSVQIPKQDYYSHLTRTRDMVENSETIIGHCNDESIILQYEKKPDSITAIKPVYIGALIYSYARKYMYDNLLFKLTEEHCLYHDTDSVKFKKSIYDTKLKHYLENSLIPHNPELELIDPRYLYHKIYEEGSKIFGGLANELKVGNNLTYINNKKEWACFIINQRNEIEWCDYSMKGIKSNAIYIDVRLAEVKKFITNISAVSYTKIYAVLSQNLALLYDIAKKDTLRFELPNIVRLVFSELHNNKVVYLMNSQFDRDIPNTGIKVSYMLKKIIPGFIN
jgi:hypothetical protein